MQMIMKSCTSTRAAACAPPPKIWICGTGSATRRSPARFFQSGIFSRRSVGVRAGERDRDHGIGAEAALVRRAVELDQALVDRLPGRRRSARAGRRGCASLMLLHRLRGVDRLAPRPSRSTRPRARSRARWRAAWCRGRRSPRPRPSAGRASPRPGGPLRRGSLPCCPSASASVAIGGCSSRARDIRAPVAAAARRQVFDRRLAVDAREQQAGQQRGGALLDVRRFPA